MTTILLNCLQYRDQLPVMEYLLVGLIEEIYHVALTVWL